MLKEKIKYLDEVRMDKGGNFDISKKGGNLALNITKNEIQHILSGKSPVSYGAPIQAISGYLGGSPIASKMDRGSKQFKKQETEELREYVYKNNLFVPKQIGKEIGEGAEQKVFFSENFVFKFNNGIFYSSWVDYFNSLLLHNYFFPDTAYELVGFSEKDGVLSAVVKQPFIKATSPTDLEFVKAFMESNGFLNTKNNDYRNTELGLILEDLHDGNVLTKDGVLYFVDTVFYVSSSIPTLSRGGILVGEKHDGAHGGITIETPTGPIIAEGGEIIINAAASKLHGKELSEINQSAGGGVPIPYELADGVQGKMDMPEQKGNGGIVLNNNEKFIVKHGLHGKGLRLKFATSPTTYTSSNISPDRQHIWVNTPTGQPKRFKISDIVYIDGKTVRFGLGGEIDCSVELAKKPYYLLDRQETIAERDRIEALEEKTAVDIGRIRDLARHSIVRLGVLLVELK